MNRFLRISLKGKILIVASILAISLVLAVGCKMFDDISGGDKDDKKPVAITSISLSKSALSISVGSMDYMAVKITPSSVQKDAKLNWAYDKSIIACDTSSSAGVTIKALAEGQTALRVSCGGYDATCIVTVSGFATGYEETTEPYIYSNTTILQTSPGVSEKVFVSLYGGDASDIDGYTWTVDNYSVAAIQPTGQYCVITAKDSGYARVKVTHTKAVYPYYIGVYVFADATATTYITTDTNILTMNMDDGEQTIDVSLVNGKDTSVDTAFAWELIKDDSGADIPVRMEHNGSKAIVTPIKGGSCTLRVTHPDAAYPLDILCRVITIVKNVYIEPNSTVVNLSGDDETTVTCRLMNIKDGDYSPDDFDYKLDDFSTAEIIDQIGNQVVIKGKANGSVKLIISHPRSKYDREVLIIVSNQTTDALDASKYITTSQNYIRTKVGAEEIEITVSLKGGVEGDEKKFNWEVTNSPSQGSSGDVITLETVDGAATHKMARMSARSKPATLVYGAAHITPKAEGMAVISISHPKIAYPTEILVKVLGKDAILEEPLYFIGQGLVKLLNGESTEYAISLKGDNKTSSDNSSIKWSIEKTSGTAMPSISGYGEKATVTAPSVGSGQTVSRLSAEHPKADAPMKAIVMTADTQEELDSMKALYSDKLYYNIEAGTNATLICSAVGFDSKDDNGEWVDYDFSQAQWTVDRSDIVSIGDSVSGPLSRAITGVKAGQAKVVCTVSEGGTKYKCEFTITVYPQGAVVTEPDVYLTTGSNVVTLSKIGDTKNVSVTAVNMPSSKYSKMKWVSDNKNIVTVLSNGTTGILTAKGEGEAVISVSHEDSQNTLQIHVRVGSEYIIQPAEPIVYVSAQDVMTLLRDDPMQKLQAVLTNGPSNVGGRFSFTIDDSSIATIETQDAIGGTAYIKPVSSGQAEITISHTATELSKKVLVVVGNSAAELAGYTYLTTSSNVVAIGEGSTRSVSVSVKNSSSPVLDGYTWESNNRNIIDITSAGATATLKGNSVGTAIVTVKNRQCQYPLQIIAQCVDPLVAGASPYIQLTSSVLTLEVNTGYTTVTADLVGGNKSDLSDFTWQTANSSICNCYGQNGEGKLKAMKSGQTYITVSHPKAAYSAQLLVICDEPKKKDCYINVPSSIITMRPTDAAQTVTATLVNGSELDKYNFKWSQDVYDVIDIQYSANICTITPKQAGTATITISHPKAAYDQQVIVNVQTYSTFSFPNDNITVTQGDVKFLQMQVPTTASTTHVEYKVGNSNICSITGTKAVAQLTAVGAGTTTVTAYLIASSTGAQQAKSEMMVYVKEKDKNAVYITSSSTIATVSKGKSRQISATLTGTGVTPDDQNNLRWSTSDTDIVQVAGIGQSGSVIGQSIYIQALKSGEAVITCSHTKAPSALQFYVVVPGNGTKTVLLNKSYITITKGSSGTQLKATIENAESNSDYNSLIWSSETVNGVNGASEVCRVMGSGQTVTIYPVSAGEATVTCQLPDSPGAAKCTVKVEAGRSFAFGATSTRVQPFHSKVISYTVSPPDALLTWTAADDSYFEFQDLGCDKDGKGSVEITGIKEGNTTLACVTDGGAKGQLTVRTAWDYSLTLKGATSFFMSPTRARSIDFTVSPIDSDVYVESFVSTAKLEFDVKNNNDGTGTIEINPRIECGDVTFDVVAKNPRNNDEVGRRTIKAKIQYDADDIVLTPLLSSDGNFSNWDEHNDRLYVGDGENVSLNLAITPGNSDISIVNIALDEAAEGVSLKNFDLANRTCVISHDNDLKSYVYRIISAVVPVKKTINYRYEIPDGHYETFTGNDGPGGGSYDYEEWIEDPPIVKTGTMTIDDWRTDFKWYVGLIGTRGHGGSVIKTLWCPKLKYYFAEAGWMYAFNNAKPNGSITLGRYDDIEEDDRLWTGKYSGWYRLRHNGTDLTSLARWNSYARASPTLEVKNDPNLANRCFSASEFESVPWFYYNRYDNYEHNGDRVIQSPHIETHNVNAVYECIGDPTVVKEAPAGQLTLTLQHLGETLVKKYEVVLQTRKCEKTFDKTTDVPAGGYKYGWDGYVWE